jgi:hypothetical protein
MPTYTFLPIYCSLSGQFLIERSCSRKIRQEQRGNNLRDVVQLWELSSQALRSGIAAQNGRTIDDCNAYNCL